MYTHDIGTASPGESVAYCESIYRLLHKDCSLHVNMETRIASLLHEQPLTILTQQQFTRNEWLLLLVLLHNYPYYAPHEMLLASITCLSVEECRRRLQDARRLGTEELRRELKPVYRAMCHIRAKLSKLHPDLKVSLVRDIGYLLTAPLQGDHAVSQRNIQNEESDSLNEW
ncbi:MAG TPA: hypothetical protein VFA09_25430 [Ktedonobacteraceae bacterium]|jgi:hypothetical protein|nr:hypothetical protein [Ktedonobacteraceae bacterium]